MCTVTYLPHASGFILTHNRDEAPSRSPQSIVREKTPLGESLLFPRDIKAGGTWIATSRYGRTACLLNGAFIKHHHAPPYRRSRGLILLDFFDWEKPDDFFQRYDLEGVEPFTFLFFEQGQAPESSSQRAVEFRWDGQQRYVMELSVEQPHFWCSATLYPPEMQIRREQVFKDWLVNHPPYNQSGNQNTANLPITHPPIESIPQSSNPPIESIPQSNQSTNRIHPPIESIPQSPNPPIHQSNQSSNRINPPIESIPQSSNPPIPQSNQSSNRINPPIESIPQSNQSPNP